MKYLEIVYAEEFYIARVDGSEEANTLDSVLDIFIVVQISSE